MQKNTHIVQTKEWGNFKSKFGTKAIRVGDLQYTLHKIPHTNFHYAYAPKIKDLNVDWNELEASLKKNNCFVLNIDVPNILKNTAEEKDFKKRVLENPNIKVSPKNTFTKNNILLDLNKTEEELLANMHKKHRYNIRVAEKKGVQVRFARTEKDFNIFMELMKETAERQNFLIHPKSYYKTVWELFAPRQMAEILIAEYQGKPLAAWMLFINDATLYYPYGGSSDEYRNLFASNLIGWEAIKYGKRRDCKTFDMWGACSDLTNESDPEWGFTNFKLKFGGEYVEYIESHDLIINKPIYYLFNFVYPKVIRVLKTLKR